MTHRSLARSFARSVALALLVVALAPGLVYAKQAPEDLLKGKIIVSDKSLPTHWSSVGSYVAQLKGMNKTTFWYDKKLGKLTINYAAFFAQPVNDVQVNVVVYDITSGAHQQKVSNEQFMNRGDRVIFNSLTLDKEDLEGNKKYLFAIEYNHRVIASTQLILRVEQEHYSGKVSFSDDETKAK